MLLLAASFPVLSSVSAASQTPSCPASQVFKMNLVSPPTSLSSLTAVGNTPFSIISLKDDSSIPTPAPSGVPYADTGFDTYSSNSNYTIWTFNVKPGLTWSDGTPASSADINATYGPNFGFNATYDFPNAAAQVVSESILNSTAVVFHLSAPNAHWPETLSYMYFTAIYPAASIASQGAGGDMIGSPAVGPFYDANYTPGAFSMTMYRNPYYRPQPSICEIQINFVDSLSLTSTYLQSGQTDLAPVEPSLVSSLLSSNPHLKLYPGTGLAIQSIQWNDTQYPFNMTAFRQAMAYGIDQQSIINQANGGYGIPAYGAEGTVSPVATTWYNPAQTQYNFNQTEAIRLLNSIGIKKGSDGFLQYSNGTDITLHLWTDTDQTPDTVAAGIVQTDLQQLGFKTDLFTTNVAGLSSNYFDGLHNAGSAMIIFTSYAGAFGSPFLDMLPGWDTYYVVTAPATTWESPSSAQAEYMSNYTAFLGTNNPALEKLYLNNVQAINAQYLPMLPLDYAPYMWMGNTQYWGNWPNPQTSYVEWGPSQMNRTLLDTLVPISGVASTTASSSSAAQGTQFSSYLIYGAVAAAVVVVVIAGFAATRRKPKAA
jgi:peptide/nickel transport system substrate-binding protein